MRAARLLTSRPVYALLVAVAVAMTAKATPAHAQSDDVFERYGFETVETSMATDGRELTVLRSAGRFADAVQISVLRHPEGWAEMLTLVMHRTVLTSDTKASQELLGSFLNTTTEGPAARNLASLVQSPDRDVRRGTEDRTMTCCAIAPPNPTYIRAVAVVDDLLPGSWVREEEGTFRFENRDGPDGRASLVVTVTLPTGAEETLGLLFDAAKSQDPAVLPELCTFVREDGDDEVHTLCDLTAEAEGWHSFVERFGTGEVTGPASIDGDRAHVPFRFGPEGDREEVMTLVRWSGVWYLISY